MSACQLLPGGATAPGQAGCLYTSHLSTEPPSGPDQTTPVQPSAKVPSGACSMLPLLRLRLADPLPAFIERAWLEGC